MRAAEAAVVASEVAAGVEPGDNGWVLPLLIGLDHQSSWQRGAL